METNTQLLNQTDAYEIDLLELAHVIWEKIWLVILGFVIGAAALFCISRFMTTPQYKASSTIYIFSKTTSITSLADVNLGNSLTGDFTYIATTREVVELVATELGLGMSYETLAKKISVTNPSNTHMLVVTVEDADPATAANISNALSEQLREQIADIMNTDKPSVVQRATIPTRQSSPNVTRNAMIGALLGALIVIAIIVARHLLDDTIKTDEDVRRYLQLDTLAELPYIRKWEDSKKTGSSGGKKAAKRAG